MIRNNLIVTVRLPFDQQEWRPPLFPGSSEALNAGCTCPARQPWPGGFRFRTDCPVHEIEKVDGAGADDKINKVSEMMVDGENDPLVKKLKAAIQRVDKLSYAAHSKGCH